MTFVTFNYLSSRRVRIGAVATVQPALRQRGALGLLQQQFLPQMPKNQPDQH
jgi:hypothetical protein